MSEVMVLDRAKLNIPRANNAAAKQLGPTTCASPEDRGLVDRLVSGDEATFAALVDRYQGGLLGLALIFVGDRAAAEDVVQDTWLAMLNGLRRFEGRSSLKSWLFAILANQARTRARQDRRWVPLSMLFTSGADEAPVVAASRFGATGTWLAPPQAWHEDTGEGLLLRCEMRSVLQTAIASLPAGQRAVVTLRDVEGFDAREVCRLLDISIVNQRVLLHRGRSKLRDTLERYLERSSERATQEAS